MRHIAPPCIAVGIVSALALTPSDASACGGFFCSSRPIVQSFERIVYARDADGTLTMIVEVEYAGVDDDFAWIVPVPSPPEVSLGTSALFDGLDAVSAPRFAYEERAEGTCRDYPRCVYEDGTEPAAGECAGTSAEVPVFIEPEPVPEPTPPPDPLLGGDGLTVYSEGAIGPYETVVLGASTAVEVTDWLGARGYIIPTAAVPLLEPYAASGNVFLALRLSANRADGQLRPLVLRSRTEEACLPIRLTAIASLPELGITAYFLGSRPVVSRNYAFAEIDLDDPTFWIPGRPWWGAVATAADAMGGRAFVTEYSGRTPRIDVAVPSVLDLAGEADAHTYLAALRQRGYPGDEEVMAVLARFVEPPAGRAATGYLDCLARSSTATCGAPTRFEPAALSAALEAEIVAPRRDAEAFVARYARLTRLSTTMSPEEMTVDPIFVEVDGVPDVPAVHRAVLVTHCSDGYFWGEAPRDLMVDEGTALDLRVGGRSLLHLDGTVADPVEYCDRYGAIPDEDADPTATVVRRCGYGSPGCSAMGHVPLWGGVLVLALAPVLWARGSRARRRDPAHRV